VNKESVASLKDRLESAMAPFTRKGIPFKTLVEQGLLLPACGLAPSAAKRRQNALCSCWPTCPLTSEANTLITEI